MKLNLTSKTYKHLQTALLATLTLLLSCASAQQPDASESRASVPQPSLHLKPTASALLEMIKQLSTLPLEDLQDAEKTIAISRLPFREIVERNGIHGIPRFFSLEELGSPIALGTYWYRKPVIAERKQVYLHFWIDTKHFCLTRLDITDALGNIWLTGFRGDRMPGAVPRVISATEPNFGQMTYLFKDGRLTDFSFNVDQPYCVANFSFNLGNL